MKDPDIIRHSVWWLVAIGAFVVWLFAFIDANRLPRQPFHFQVDAVGAHMARICLKRGHRDDAGERPPVLSGHVFDIARGKPARPDANAAYFAALSKLTVESWRRAYR
jgi:hypothetical protein